MNDNQRESMFNAWAERKIHLEVFKKINPEFSEASVEYKGKIYSEKVLSTDVFGTANPFNVAFNRLWDKMRYIDKDIELKYPI